MGLRWMRGDNGDGGAGGLSDTAAMLAELRAIRTEISRLAERIGEAATREDLKRYVTVELFEHHLESHKKGVENWRTWLPWAVMVAISLFELLSGHAAKLLGGG